MKYIIIKNFDKFQAYQDRRISWVKLHIQILDSFDFYLLDDSEKYLFVGLLMLAGKLENKIPYHDDFIRSKLHFKSPKNILDILTKFVENGFIEYKEYRREQHSEISRTKLGLICDIDKIREDKIREDKIREDNKEDTTKPIYLDFSEHDLHNVKITQEELDKVVAKYGEDVADEYIQKLDSYVGSKGRKYKSHYYTVLNWIRKDAKPVIAQTKQDISPDEQADIDRLAKMTPAEQVRLEKENMEKLNALAGVIKK